MKFQLIKPVVAILSISGLVSLSAFAETTDDTKALQAQLADLQKEVQALKNQQPAKKTHSKTKHKKTVAHHGSLKGPSPTNQDHDSVQPLSRAELQEFIKREREFLPFDLDVPGQAFVSTGPYVGVPIQYSGSNLIVNSPSVNTDVQLLNIRKSIIEQLAAMGGEIAKEPYHSHLLLSGLTEVTADYNDVGGGPSTSDINVTSVSLDAFFIGPSEWTLGFVEFNYDSATPANSVFSSTSSYRTENSTVYINKAFITVGDFERSPYYGSVGQFYVPFGTYSSVMISDPLTKLLARTKERALLIGMQQQSPNAFYGAAYIFKGDSHAASVSKINNGGINVGYRFKGNTIHGDIGAGVLGNLADSGGMQVGNGFQSYEQIVHRVPAYDVRGLLSLGNHVDLIAEYVGASTQFNPFDMSYNGSGAKPWAMDFEAAYSFYILDERPSSLGLSYGKSNEALSLGLPLTRTALVFGTSIWRNTLQTVEIRRDREYAASSFASGAGGAVSSPEGGKYDHAITAQFDYYF